MLQVEKIINPFFFFKKKIDLNSKKNPRKVAEEKDSTIHFIWIIAE